jgi:tRNA(fMet)-specific endonuclease VapC
VILLDTSICVELLRGTCEPALQRLLAADPDKVRIPTVAAGELLFGARKSGSARALTATRGFVAKVGTEPFNAVAAEHYGILRQTLLSRGTQIGPNHLLIAATALACGAILATANVGEFSRVPGLAVENWRDPSP